MRHVVIRTIMGLIWIGTGIVSVFNGNIMNLFFGLIMGAAFIASAVSMSRKNKAVK